MPKRDRSAFLSSAQNHFLKIKFLEAWASASLRVFRNENATIITIAAISGTYDLNYEGGATFLACIV